MRNYQMDFENPYNKHSQILSGPKLQLALQNVQSEQREISYSSLMGTCTDCEWKILNGKAPNKLRATQVLVILCSPLSRWVE